MMDLPEQSGQPLRIFVDAHALDGAHEGVRRHVQELYRRLANRSDLLIFLTAYDTQSLASAFPPSRSLVFLRYRSRSRMVRLLVEIPRMIRRHRIDYAHFQHLAPPVRNCRQILTIHDLLFLEKGSGLSLRYRWPRRILFRFSARRADLLLTVSEHSKAALQRHCDLPAERISLVGNGVDEDFFASYDKAVARQAVQERFGFRDYLFCLSRLEPRKDPQLLVQAWAELKLYEQGLHLVLSGKRSLPLPALDGVLKRLPDKARPFLHLTGEVSEDDLLCLFRGARLFVYPSRAEGFGIPPLEAAALRIPVICTRGGALEAYSFFGAGHIEPQSLRALKEALLFYLNEPPAEERLQAIADEVRNRYGWEETAHSLITALAHADTRPERKRKIGNPDGTKVLSPQILPHL